METGDDIVKALGGDDAQLSLEWVESVMQKHPAFAMAGAMLLRSGADIPPDKLKRLRAWVMLNSPDRQAMADYANLSGSDWQNIYPMAKTKQKSTEDTIDDFIEAYGQSSPAENALLERLIFHPVAPDYFEGTDLPMDPENPLALPAELAWDNQPKEASEPSTPASPMPEPEHHPSAPQNEQKSVEEPSLMESLAKIFVKQGRYSRAFEIIKSLSLKYPEKSVYFADQLRFLQKLMVNQNYQPDKNQ